MNLDSFQPPLGTLNHISFCVNDYPKCVEFYDSVLTRLGYKILIKTEFYASWLHPRVGRIAIIPAQSQNKNEKHNRYSVGFHHLALNATSRKEIDDFHDFLVEKKYKVLDVPQEHYVPGYYAVFWEDPNGLKFELSHVSLSKYCASLDEKKHIEEELIHKESELTEKNENKNICKKLG
ncbi:907_t:CDS:2 [Diversispora eburnea]|uniref:907_t:CDS:1 n=1 Tax=Diversispora eburnea TaxID=1213867 RepID=A0A9N8VZK0_9GLOM|nr:907_t:CDS:2 [Diversispora eburnea]